VAVTEDDHIRLQALNLVTERQLQVLRISKDVKHEDPDAIKVEGSFRFESWRQIPLVNIAVHGSHWGESLELPEDLQFADVASMEDMVDCPENLRQLRIEEAVSIGNDPDSLILH
jgi:hypothetical protein